MAHLTAMNMGTYNSIFIKQSEMSQGNVRNEPLYFLAFSNCVQGVI